jgi:hypothetical protein
VLNDTLYLGQLNTKHTALNRNPYNYLQIPTYLALRSTVVSAHQIRASGNPILHPYRILPLPTQYPFRSNTPPDF